MGGKVPLPRISSSIRELTHILHPLLFPQVSNGTAWGHPSDYPLRVIMLTEMD